MLNNSVHALMLTHVPICMDVHAGTHTHTHTRTHTVNNVGKVACFVPTLISTEFETLIIFPVLPFPLCL